MSTIEVNKITPVSGGTATTLGDSGDTFTAPTGVGLTVTDEVKTNKISPASGTSFTLGDSGDTFTIPSGATIANSGTATGFGGANTPAFSALLGFNQSQTLTDNVDTKITMNTEEFDTDGAFDTSNYRFTVPVGAAGKYFFYYWVYVYGGTDSDLRWANVRLYKNGSANFSGNENDFRTGYPRSRTLGASLVCDCAEGDYFEVYVQAYDFTGDPEAYGGMRATRFGGYKLVT